LAGIPWGFGQHVFTVLWVTIIIASTVGNFIHRLRKPIAWTTGAGVLAELAVIFILNWVGVRKTRPISPDTCKTWLDAIPTVWAMLKNTSMVLTHVAMAAMSGLLVVGAYYNM
jgi:hypothetical protein